MATLHFLYAKVNVKTKVCHFMSDSVKHSLSLLYTEELKMDNCPKCFHRNCETNTVDKTFEFWGTVLYK